MNAETTIPSPETHRCPWWMQYVLVSPLRRLFDNPKTHLGPHVRPGMTVLEPGCGMGYFSLPLARMVGASGRVLCADVEHHALERLEGRARRAGLAERIVAAPCTPAALGLAEWKGRVDLVAAMHMFHEVAEPAAFRPLERAPGLPAKRAALLVRE